MVSPLFQRSLRETKDIFKLEEIYYGHTEELTDLFYIRYKLSERYLEELMKTYNNMGINREEIYKLSFGAHYNEDDFLRRPFSKIKKDILLLSCSGAQENRINEQCSFVEHNPISKSRLFLF